MLTFPADVHPVSADVTSGSGGTVHLRVTPSGLAPLPSTSTGDLTTSAALLDTNVKLASPLVGWRNQMLQYPWSLRVYHLLQLDLQPATPLTPSMSLISEDTTGVLNTPDHVSCHPKDWLSSHLFSSLHITDPFKGPQILHNELL